MVSGSVPEKKQVHFVLKSTWFDLHCFHLLFERFNDISQASFCLGHKGGPVT